MIPELGHYALIAALILALVQGVLPLWGAARGDRALLAVARPAAYGQLAFLCLAYAALTQAFIVSDFSLLYVANNSNTALPLIYRVAAVWGAHEGSLLLWGLILGLWTVAVCLLSRSLPAVFAARVIAVMGLISIGFLAFLLLTSNPFTRLYPPAAEGRDLNPLLQDPGLIIHPPMLYLGYVGFSVAFAFAIAALLGGRLDAAWARWSRPWTAIAWTFLTFGIALGSWWAYNELGWGGWWFWDPVENASFMPWLAGTALLHSLVVTEKRAAFKAWTVLLSILTFSLSLMGTFLVRSGVLVSVHAFATDPARGVFILAFMVVVVGGALILYAIRARHVRMRSTFAPLSRETLLLLNNAFLVVATASVLLGTLYPLLVDALGWGKISVGPPYFTAVFAPLMLPLAVLVGIGPFTRWKQQAAGDLIQRLRIPALAAVTLAALALLVFAGLRGALAALAVSIGLWVISSTLMQIYRRVKGKGSGELRRLPRGFWGMTLAHFGLGVFILGVTATNTLSLERDVRLAPGEAVELAGYRYTFLGTQDHPGPNYEARRARVVVTRDAREVAVLYPEKRVYRVQQNAMTEAAIDVGILRDLYVALGEPLGDGAWSLRVYYKPLIRWIWGGALCMALGGLCAATDRRYRLLLPAARETLPAANQVAA